MEQILPGSPLSLRRQNAITPEYNITIRVDMNNQQNIIPTAALIEAFDSIDPFFSISDQQSHHNQEEQINDH
jgi:hypothetical protein